MMLCTLTLDAILVIGLVTVVSLRPVKTHDQTIHCVRYPIAPFSLSTMRLPVDSSSALLMTITIQRKTLLLLYPEQQPPCS